MRSVLRGRSHAGDNTASGFTDAPLLPHVPVSSPCPRKHFPLTSLPWAFAACPQVPNQRLPTPHQNSAVTRQTIVISAHGLTAPNVDPHRLCKWPRGPQRDSGCQGRAGPEGSLSCLPLDTTDETAGASLPASRTQTCAPIAHGWRPSASHRPQQPHGHVSPGRASTSTGSDTSDGLPTPLAFTARTLKT